MPTQLNDVEFGVIDIRRTAKATAIRLRVAPNGLLKASMPLYAPIFLLKRLIDKSRDDLRNIISTNDHAVAYEDGATIGKSHTLVHDTSRKAGIKVERTGTTIIISTSANARLSDTAVRRALRPVVIEALKREAKSYLPRRLKVLAERYGFAYTRVRFSHASSRWGSCSSNGTISLNIALMKLSFELIDYVLIHELSHTKHMNHSTDFWNTVASCDKAYKIRRQALKTETPSI